jgi:hypothetical protein
MYHNIIVNDENIYNFKIEKPIHFLKRIIIRFVNVETDPRLPYLKLKGGVKFIYIYNKVVLRSSLRI